MTGTIDDVTLRTLRETSYTLGARVLSFIPGREYVGDDVVQLQRELQELGFYTGHIDGHYDEITYNAVRDYQFNYELTADGICGPETVRALGLLGRRIAKGGSAAALREKERVRLAGPLLAGKRVVIDPGFGLNYPGMSVRGPYGQITEEEILWDLASRVEGRMVSAGIETIMSHPRQLDPTPQERADVANSFGADLMICLRSDHYKNEKAHGVATFYYGSESGANSITGEMLSGFVQREIVARTPLTNCYTHGRSWDVLRLSKMPAIQVVVGYVTNPQDVTILTDPDMRNTIAEAIVVAVKRLYLLDQDTQPTGTYSFNSLLIEELRG